MDHRGVLAAVLWLLVDKFSCVIFINDNNGNSVVRWRMARVGGWQRNGSWTTGESKGCCAMDHGQWVKARMAVQQCSGSWTMGERRKARVTVG